MRLDEIRGLIPSGASGAEVETTGNVFKQRQKQDKCEQTRLKSPGRLLVCLLFADRFSWIKLGRIFAVITPPKIKNKNH